MSSIADNRYAYMLTKCDKTLHKIVIVGQVIADRTVYVHM